MEQLQMELAGEPKTIKIQVLRGLMQCVGSDGKAIRPFVLNLALNVVVEVPQVEVVPVVKWLVGVIKNG
jgi:hypothetical protein